MSAGLAGVDPTAQTGNSGDAGKTAQMEPVAEMVENRSEVKSELDHTNISMSLDVLVKQFIYNGTYQWRVTDAPGTIIGSFPIHPESCNQYTAHAYQMFGSYGGGMKANVRIIGTAFYGGALYLIRVPPQYTAVDLQKFGLAGLTAFPHTDLDPKNLDAVNIKLEDYRAEHFHTGPLNTNDWRSYGGTLFMVVAARLVTQSDMIQALDIKVELAGDFEFRVPVPIRTANQEVNGPLTSLDTYGQSGCDDGSNDQSEIIFQVLQESYTKYDVGNLFLKNNRGEYTYTQANADISGIALTNPYWTWENIETLRSKIDQRIMPRGLYNFHPFRAGRIVLANDSTWFGVNFQSASNTGMTAQVVTVGDETTYDIVQINGLSFNVTQGETDSLAEVTAPRITGNGYIAMAINGPASGYNIAEDFTPLIIPRSPNLTNESFVAILTNGGNTSNANTAQWTKDLSTFTNWPTGSAAIYSLVDDAEKPVAYFKLRPNGHWYAPASSTTFGLKGRKLVFKQWVPDREPIPTTSSFYRREMGALMKQAAHDYAVKASAPRK